MQDMFTQKNVDALCSTCVKIKELSKESVDGKFTAAQLMFLGSLITEFVENPIVATSGLLTGKK